MLIATIYKILNINNGKVYIGFTKNKPSIRWNEHRRRSKIDQRKFLYKSMRKHGIETFEFQIIYQSTDIDHTHNEMERYFIAEYNSMDPSYGYNTSSGGEGSSFPRPKGENSFWYGRKHSDESRAIIREKATGRIPTQEARKNMKKAQIGRKHSPETVEKMRELRSKNVYQITTPSGEVLETRNLVVFARDHGLQQSELSRVANGLAKSHKGFIVCRVPDIFRLEVPTDSRLP